MKDKSDEILVDITEESNTIQEVKEVFDIATLLLLNIKKAEGMIDKLRLLKSETDLLHTKFWLKMKEQYPITDEHHCYIDELQTKLNRIVIRKKREADHLTKYISNKFNKE